MYLVMLFYQIEGLGTVYESFLAENFSSKVTSESLRNSDYLGR